MFDDYKAWLKVADTALPRNIFGYILQLLLSPLRANPFITSPYDNPREIAKCGDVGTKSYLRGSLLDRGERPTILKWMAPNRCVKLYYSSPLRVIGMKIAQEDYNDFLSTLVHEEKT